jgi:chromosome segregation ATPase
LGGKRTLTAQEIVWVAKALDVAEDELLGGVALPEAARKAVDLHRQLAERVIAAESERDAAKAALKSLEEQHRRTEARHAEEREDLERQVIEIRQRSSQSLADAERKAAERERRLQEEVTSLRTQVRALEGQVVKFQATESHNRREMGLMARELLRHRQAQAQWKAAVASERAGKEVASALCVAALLGGLAIGVGAASPTPRRRRRRA